MTDMSYDDLSSEELYDEIQGLDDEIADYQGTLGKLRRSLKQKEELREKLIDVWMRKSRAPRWS